MQPFCMFAVTTTPATNPLTHLLFQNKKIALGVGTTPSQRLSDVWLLTEQNVKQKFKEGSNFSTLCYFTLPGTKLCVCLPLSFLYSPRISQCHHSPSKEPFEYSLFHLADSTNNFKQVGTLPSPHTLQPKETQQMFIYYVR